MRSVLRVLFAVFIIQFLWISPSAVFASIIYSQPGLVDHYLDIPLGWKRQLLRNGAVIESWKNTGSWDSKGEVYFSDTSPGINPKYKIRSYKQRSDGTWEFQGESGEITRNTDYAEGVLYNDGEFGKSRSRITWTEEIRVKDVIVKSGELGIYDAKVILEAPECLIAEGGAEIWTEGVRFEEYEEDSDEPQVHGGTVVLRDLDGPHSGFFEQCTFGPGTGLIVEDSSEVVLLHLTFEGNEPLSQGRNALTFKNVTQSTVESCTVPQLYITGSRNLIHYNDIDRALISGATNHAKFNDVFGCVRMEGDDLLVRHNRFRLLDREGCSWGLSATGANVRVMNNDFGGEDESEKGAMSFTGCTGGRILDNLIDGEGRVYAGITMSDCSNMEVESNRIAMRPSMVASSRAFYSSIRIPITLPDSWKQPKPGP